MAGQPTLEAEIDNLLREKKEIKQWAVGSVGLAAPNRGDRIPKNRIGDPALAGYGRKVHRIGWDRSPCISGSLPSNANVVSPNIIILTFQCILFCFTRKSSYNALAFECLVITNAVRKDTFILLSGIRLT